MLSNRIELIEVFVACGCIGAAAVPLNTASMGPQIGYVLQDSDARLLVIEGDFAPRLAVARRRSLGAAAAVIVLLMGPAGSGKTTVGELLASQLGWEFADGDSFHSPANIEKMSRGVSLDDHDRIPWLDAIRAAMEYWNAQRRNVVLACSALKKSYRERLLINSAVRLVYLKGTFDLLRQRLHARKGHYATEQILKSQFADLEEPADAITMDVARSPEEIVAQIRKQLSL
jgi:gluconokinase